MALIKLYLVRVSPTCRAVWLYLLQHNIDHVIVDITSPDDLEEISEPQELGGHINVPILTDGDIIVFEAPAIIEYLAKNYTNYAGFGTSKEDQVRCSSLLSWTNSEIHRITGYMYIYPQYFDKYRLDSESANEALIESGLRELTRQLNRIESKILNESSYDCGSELSIADSFLVTTLIQAELADFNFTIWPKVRRWFQLVKHHPHWDDIHSAHNEFIKEMER